MKTIMIVDNEQHFHDFYSEMLRDTDCEIISAYDSNDAFSKLNTKKPNLIVLDELSSLDIVFDIRRKRKRFSHRVENIPVIIANDFFLQVILVRTFLTKK